MTEQLSTNGKLFVLLVIAFFTVITIAGFIARISEYIDDINELKRMMYHSDSEHEFRHWKRELRIRRLRALTGLPPRAIEKILHFFSRK